jgi:hypothetical protein
VKGKENKNSKATKLDKLAKKSAGTRHAGNVQQCDNMQHYNKIPLVMLCSVMLQQN